MLEVRLLGTFSIQCDSKPVRLSSRRAQSLFAYLILTAGTLHRREKLAGMFWPEASEEKARAYLRHELWRIRKALSSASKGDYLLADDINIALNASSEFWLDVMVLKKQCESASISDLMEALSACKGQFLPDFYDEWIAQEREHVRALYEQTMARLLELLEQEKRWKDMLVWAEDWIAQGGGPEVAYRSLMLAYKSLGDHAKVHSTYERCKQALHELDMEPSEQTSMLVSKRANSLHVPIPLTSFIGREKELREVADLVSKYRLVTLTGSGGVGKTRLTIQVVAEVLKLFPDGVWFLDLASFNDPALVPSALAGLLGLREPTDSNTSILNLLKGHLHLRSTLLVIDNCEHLIKSCSHLIDALLPVCPNLHILTTSREAFRIAGEIPYRVPSLEVPKSDTETAIDILAKTESVQLFLERAAVASPGFAIQPQNAQIIIKICKRLDGIPLAIELAAARVNVLTTEQILNRLDDRFQLLTQGERTALPRHQTLQSMIDWSYNLLSERERVLLQRISVFAGGWTLEAAEFICAGDGIEAYEILDLLTKLLNKSLIVAERKQGQQARYQMLETIRHYALQKSEQDSRLALKHCTYFANFVGTRYPAILTHRQQVMVYEILPEIANVRLAWAYAIKFGAYRELRTMAESLMFFFEFSNHMSEGSFFYREAARIWDQCPLEDPLARSAFAFCISYDGYFEWRLGHYEKAIQRLTDGIQIFRVLNDTALAVPLYTMGAVLAFGGQVHQALQCLDESEQILKRENRETEMWLIGWARGIAFLHQGDLERAKEHLLVSVAWCHKTGDPRASNLATSFLGRVYMERGELAEAESTVLDCLAQSRLRSDTFGIGMDLRHLAFIAFAKGSIQKAVQLLHESLSAFESIGDTSSYLSTLTKLADMQLATHQLDQARQSYSRVVELANESGNLPYLLDGVVGLGEIMLQTGDKKKAVAWLEFVWQNKSANPDTKIRVEKALEDLQVSRTKEPVLSLDNILTDVR